MILTKAVYAVRVPIAILPIRSCTGIPTLTLLTLLTIAITVKTKTHIHSLEHSTSTRHTTPRASPQQPICGRLMHVVCFPLTQLPILLQQLV